jgi:hypothetical protein
VADQVEAGAPFPALVAAAEARAVAAGASALSAVAIRDISQAKG